MKKVFIFSGVLLCSLLYQSCGDRADDPVGIPYDPGKPVALTRFYPDSGRIRDKVLFEGENFGNDPSQIRVWFNHKRAPVIGSNGKMMYAVVPRLPGDTCVISVAVGNDSVAYSHKFRYKISVTTTTIAGNGSATYSVGTTPGESAFDPQSLVVDENNNIFLSVTDPSDAAKVRGLKINEEENTIEHIFTNGARKVSPTLMPDGSLYLVSDVVRDVFWSYDPLEGWGEKTRYMQWAEGSAIPTNVWKKAVVYCEHDEMLYTLFFNGHLVQLNPRTLRAETVARLVQGDAHGMAFHPIHKNMLYVTYNSSAGAHAHGISTLDITDPVNTYRRINATGVGHRDGELAVAQFNNPCQLFFDAEGNIYIADDGNHCIRRVNTAEGIVETVVGQPGVAGYQEGGKDDSLFKNPWGVYVAKDGTIYVSDRGNCRLRKLVIE